MRVQDAKEQLHIAARFGDAQLRAMFRLIGKAQDQPHRRSHQPGILQAQTELIQHAPQQKEQRLQALDGMLQLQGGAKTHRQPN